MAAMECRVWESYVNGRFWKADTLAGIKEIIREAKRGNIR